jgi:hypothetical protein
LAGHISKSRLQTASDARILLAASAYRFRSPHLASGLPINEQKGRFSSYVYMSGKNNLFGGSNGGERAAAMYSLIALAKLNDIDPKAYLSHVLVRVADHPIIPSIESRNSCPWNVIISDFGQLVTD